jgi:quercetin dioxygenase-like cupin family protein
METRGTSTPIADGLITYVDRDEQTGQIQWNDHPKFRGVSLKHLVTGRDTGGRLSCHLVKLAPNSVLDEHVHEDRIELHEVIEGEGCFILDARKTAYHPGRVGVIPEGVTHKVIAGNSGLVILAKFCPALV